MATKREKVVTFTSSDAKLVRKIEKYQKTRNLKSFIAAVRELCDNALTLKEIVK